MNQPTDTSSDGELEARSKQAGDYDDALVLATAMASGGSVEKQQRSPSGGTHSQLKQEDEEDDSDGRDDSSSTEHDPYYDQPKFPPSPLVTPPTRIFSASGEVVHRNEYIPPVKKQSLHPISAAVPHVYHDYSLLPDDSSYIRKKTGGVTQPFPEKLHEMLQSVEGTEAMETVAWLPHGRAFLVRKPKDFTDTIMPKYFKQTKLTSFQRQLNLYGFRRITQGADAGAYYHALFLKARPGLCQRMARQKVKGTGHKQPADAKTEPNFYEMRPAESAPPPQGFVPHNFSFIDDRQQQVPAPLVQHASEAAATAPARSALVDPYSSPWVYSQPPHGSVLDSPASPGLHGAAHLLQGIASGYVNLSLPSESSLGPAAATESTNTDDEGDLFPSPQRQRTPVSFLQPRLPSPSSFEKR